MKNNNNLQPKREEEEMRSDIALNVGIMTIASDYKT